MKYLDYNLQHGSRLSTSCQNNDLGKERNWNIIFSLRSQVVLL